MAFKKITVRYTGQKLHEKGVILEVEGLPHHQSVVQIHCTQQNCEVFVLADLEMLRLKSLLLVWEPLKFQLNSWELLWKRLNWYSRYIEILIFRLKQFSVFLAGSSSATIRGTRGYENVWTGKDQCQFTDLFDQQEVLWDIGNFINAVCDSGQTGLRELYTLFSYCKITPCTWF